MRSPPGLGQADANDSLFLALSALKVAKEAKEDPASEVATVQSELGSSSFSSAYLPLLTSHFVAAVESLDSAVAVVEGTGKEPVVVAKC